MPNTDRVFKANKIISFPFTGVTATATLADTLGRVYQNISDVAWTRIVLEVNLTGFAGSSSPSVTFSAITTNDQQNAGATTDPAAKQGDGTTTFATSAMTATGRAQVSLARQASTGATASNVGKFIGLQGVIANTVTTCAGTVWLYIEGQ